MFIHTIIAIQYIDLGYLPNYPYHMITDKEMIEAFIGEGNYFDTMYPCPDESMREAYDALKDAIKSTLNDYLDSNTDVTTIPDWIYSYMLGNVTTFDSDPEEIEYLYELTGIEPAESYDTFDKYLAQECLCVSTEWLKKQSSRTYKRVPTMFGEAHVIKSLRLTSADILSNG